MFIYLDMYILRYLYTYTYMAYIDIFDICLQFVFLSLSLSFSLSPFLSLSLSLYIYIYIERERYKTNIYRDISYLLCDHRLLSISTTNGYISFIYFLFVGSPPCWALKGPVKNIAICFILVLFIYINSTWKIMVIYLILG